VPISDELLGPMAPSFQTRLMPLCSLEVLIKFTMQIYHNIRIAFQAHHGP